MPTQIPPWLNFDPMEAVRIKVAANQQRNNMAAAELQAQVARERMMADAQQHQDALALKYQEAADMAAYRKEEGERRRSEGAALERLRQQKYEQDALEASIRMEGMRDYETGIAHGETPATAFSRNAHKLLFKNPAAMERFAENVGEGGELTEQTTTGGAAYLSRPGGRPHFVPRSSLPQAELDYAERQIAPGLRGVQTGPNSMQITSRPGQLSDLEKAQLIDLRRQETFLQQALKGQTPEDIAEQPHLQQFELTLKEIARSRQGIYDKAADQEMPLITSREQRDKLPPGTYYRDKDGNVAYKQ